ncbi:hypothetical protein Xcel_3044 [Xylanimonas cellulosilytica DSM 15894]|uniref:Uncharacterized protein n=1 Tax=Xylanimonas cellulosilytica (strain DSM 15894 / JCM 12276 / CECT 5975 / KCTC 9989 / LMG 20990 / NBRC 107835 / XIL07) TaxID=446471 RepID=D1BZS2_XYLCX|nr:hypothetical protein [Xylanimonas cellulosilytica]ACZ32050.1 hypothetical protein Xcel_3044 [Xylanimonas cellulosilytica DSM 15894]
MSDATDGQVVADDCSNLRQGDVVDLAELRLPVAGGEFESVATPAGVAILSQTCDVVQPSKARCLVAPVVVDPTDAALSGARKGQKPLHLYLETGGTEPVRCIADMERAVSILKSDLSGSRLVARYVAEASGREARAVAWRVGRAFNRFPFPDEVYPAFSKLRRQAQDKAGSAGNFGRVLDLVEDLRVCADQWASPGRNLTLYIVVAEERLVPPDEMDPNWQWNPSRVAGLRAGEAESGLSLDRACELLLANLDGDRTSLAHLWRMFGATVESKLLAPSLDTEVVSFGVEVLSDAEMTYRQYQQTESLDLEVLSDSTGAST